MKPRRIQRVNSLLKEVLSEVIMHDIKHRNIPELITITEVDTAADLTSAKVFISLIADSRQKKNEVVAQLQAMSGYIATLASKKVTLRYFPSLTFKVDDSIDNYMKIDEILKKISHE